MNRLHETTAKWLTFPRGIILCATTMRQYFIQLLSVPAKVLMGDYGCHTHTADYFGMFMPSTYSIEFGVPVQSH